MTTPSSKRGFASKSKDELRAISKRGGECSTQRSFRDIPGLAQRAAALSFVKMTPEQRRERARKAGLASAARKKALDAGN